MSASSNLTLKQVENELKEVSDWYSLGVQLGVETAKLKAIEKEHPREPKRCKLDVLDFWFTNARDRSWKALLKALEALGEHGRLVSELNSRYCTDACREEGSVNVVVAESSDANEESTARELVSGITNLFCYKECSVNKVVIGTNEESAAELVLGKTNLDPSGALAHYPQIPAPQSDFGQGMSPILHQSALPPFIENLYSKAESYEKLMPPDGCEYNEEDLEVETTEIMLKFGTLVSKVQMELENQGITVEVLASHFEKIPALKPVHVDSKTSLLSESMEEIHSKKTVREAVDVVAKYYTSWFNHYLIENLIETFFDDDHIIQKRLQDFRELFKKYCQNRLSKCPQEEWGLSHQRNTSNVIVKVDREWAVAKVTQVAFIRKTIAKILDLEQQTLYLRTVRNGCIELTFLVPKFVANAAFPFSIEPDKTANALSKAGVLELHCEKFSFYRYSQHMNFRRDLYAWDPDRIVYVKHFIGETDESSGAMPDDEVRLSPEGQESSDTIFPVVKQIACHPPLPVSDLLSPTTSLPERNSDISISEDLIQLTDTDENSECTGFSVQCSERPGNFHQYFEVSDQSSEHPGTFNEYFEHTEGSDSCVGFSSLEYSVSSDDICPSTELLCRHNFNNSAEVDEFFPTSSSPYREFDDTDIFDLTERSNRSTFYSLPTQCSPDEQFHVCTGALYCNSTSCIAVVY